MEKNLAISLGMLGRTLKTLGRATGPIVSCLGTAEKPKGTKKLTVPNPQNLCLCFLRNNTRPQFHSEIVNS